MREAMYSAGQYQKIRKRKQEEDARKAGWHNSDDEDEDDFFDEVDVAGDLANVQDSLLKDEAVEDRPVITEVFRTIYKSLAFRRLIVIVIVLNAVLVGLQTDPTLSKDLAAEFDVIDWVILGIFTMEIVFKLGGKYPYFYRYFFSFGNVFDFVVVFVGYFNTGHDEFVTILRTARLLRILKLFQAMPVLQLLTATLLKSLRSMVSVLTLLGIQFYIYGVLGVFLFRDNDPVHFSDLGISLLTLFRCLTLEDWTDVMYINMYGCKNYGYANNPHRCTHSDAQNAASVVFFVTFILLGTYVMLNLFVSAIITNFMEAEAEILEQYLEKKEAKEAKDMDSRFNEMTKAIVGSVKSTKDSVRAATFGRSKSKFRTAARVAGKLGGRARSDADAADSSPPLSTEASLDDEGTTSTSTRSRSTLSASTFQRPDAEPEAAADDAASDASASPTIRGRRQRGRRQRGLRAPESDDEEDDDARSSTPTFVLNPPPEADEVHRKNREE